MPTTPDRQLKVIVGGSRTVLKERAKWVEYEYEGIGVPGREFEDGVVYVPKIGWRLVDVRTLGHLGYETGADADNILTVPGQSSLATYADDSTSLQTRFNQRYFSELGFVQGSQTTQGDKVVRKNARALSGLGSDLSAFPQPSMDLPVPLDRCSVSTEQLDADDRLFFSFSVEGQGSHTLGAIYRCYFPQIAGTSKADHNAGYQGNGIYSLTLFGSGTAILHEQTVYAANPADPDHLPQWSQRASFSWCESSRVMRNTHRITVEGDARRDGTGRLYGKRFRISFSSFPATGGWGQVLATAANVAEFKTGKPGILDEAFEYVVPNASLANQPTATSARIDARQDCAVTFQAVRTTFQDSGNLRVNTISLGQAPADGLVHVQVFGSIPTGTSINLRLFGARSGTECTAAATPVDHVGAKFVDFTAIPGERSYILNIEMSASSDLLKSPTIHRVRFIREASFTVIEEPEIELVNVTTVSITGSSSDPSTETLGLVCYDFTGVQNAILSKKAGMRIRVEADLGPVDPAVPDGPRIKSVLFRGIIRSAKRTAKAGKGKQGFSQGVDYRKGPFTRFVVKAASEFEWLRKQVAPGRLNLAYDSTSATPGAPPKQFKVSDLVRDLLHSILPANRVDVPDLPILLPFDQDVPASIEALQPVMSLAMSLWRDYAGGWIGPDHNASAPADDPRGTTTEGMWRAKIAPKRSKLKTVAEFWREPVIAANTPAHPGAYPDNVETTGSGEDATTRNIPRTYLRQNSEDEWIEPPECNVVIVRGVGTVPLDKAQALNNTACLTVTLCNWKAAAFQVDRNADGTLPPAQGASGGPPAPDPDSIDYTTGDVLPFIHSDPMLNTFEGIYFVARRLFDLKAHAKYWATGESPLILVKPETTGDALQINPRPLLFGDAVTVKGAIVTVTSDMTGRVDADGLFVMAESPTLLIDGIQGGSRFMQAYNAMYSAPPDDSYRSAYGDPYA